MPVYNQAAHGASPLISVILCTYNRAAVLHRAVDSLRHQTITQWEGIIVDGGSTDNTAFYAETLTQIDQRFRYIRQPNTGVAAARNVGLHAGRGIWTTFLDSDDEYEPEHLELRLAAATADPETDMIYGGVRVLGGPAWVPDARIPHRRIPIAECFVGGTFFVRTDWARRLGGFQRPDYGNGYDFAQRAMATGAKIRQVAAPTYVYNRNTQDSLCNLMENSCRRVASM